MAGAISGRLWRIIRLLLTVVTALYAVSILIFSVYYLVERRNVALYEFIRTTYWFALYPAPLFALFALGVRRRWLFGLLLVPTLVFTFNFGQMWLRGNHAADGRDTFTILTFNILTRYGPFDQIITVIEQSDADIVALQVLSIEAADALTQALEERYPYQALDPQDGKYAYIWGQGIFSRYPITDSSYWRYEDIPKSQSHGQQRAAITIKGQEIVVYNVHPWPPFGWYDGRGLVFGSGIDKAHRISFERLAERAFDETLPVLFVGDMNMSPQFHEYDLITGHFADSFGEVGRGPGYTYPACGVSILPQFMDFSVIRLDYVFHSAQFTAISAHVLDGCPVSDHDALLVELALE